MALTLPRPTPKANGKYHIAWRVAPVALFLAVTIGVTAVVFLFIPLVNNSVKLALEEGGIVFVWAVIVPSGILALISTGWGIRILWRVSEDISTDAT